jgi:hypothetical protein
MHKHLGSLTLGAGLALAPGLHAALFNFDSLPAGSLANDFSTSALRFAPAVFAPDRDADDLEIPGTEKWRPDPAAPPVIVDNPLAYGRGPAPSPDNALDALLQPVLLKLAAPVEIAAFSATLDNDDLGMNGFDPAFADVAVHFLGADGRVLLQLPVNQTQPGFRVILDAPLADVNCVLLPAGAFYDDLVLMPIPETSSWPMMMGLGALGLALWRRRAA